MRACTHTHTEHGPFKCKSSLRGFFSYSNITSPSVLVYLHMKMTTSLFLSAALGESCHCSSQLPLYTIIEAICGSGGILGFWPHLKIPKRVIFSLSFLGPVGLLHQPSFPLALSFLLRLFLSSLSFPLSLLFQKEVLQRQRSQTCGPECIGAQQMWNISREKRFVLKFKSKSNVYFFLFFLFLHMWLLTQMST